MTEIRKKRKKKQLLHHTKPQLSQLQLNNEKSEQQYKNSTRKTKIFYKQIPKMKKTEQTMTRAIQCSHTHTCNSTHSCVLRTHVACNRYKVQ